MARPLQFAAGVRIVLVAAVATCLGGCAIESLFVGSGCTDHDETVWSLHEPTDPSTTLKIEDCRQDSDACEVLCTMELDANVSNVNTMTDCQVRFESQTVHVDVKYDVQSTDPGCQTFGDDQPVVGTPNVGGG
jgi:hypothetical protein